MTRLSQTKSAKLAGCSRATISNRIKDGLLTEQPDGIDIADLVRVFPKITSERIDRFLTGEPLSGDRQKASDTSGSDESGDVNDEAMAAVLSANNWMRELADRQEATIKEQSQQLVALVETHSVERKGWTEQMESVRKLLPAPGIASLEPQLATAQAESSAKDQQIQSLSSRIDELSAPKSFTQRFKDLWR